jgi:hypothetical protein
MAGTETPMRLPDFGVTATDALSVVGLTVADVTAVAGEVLTDGSAYLAGSLASGVGNAGSDVDIHVIRPGLSRAGGPFLHFVNGVIVEIECYPSDWVAEVRERARSSVVVRTPAGPIALDTRLRGRALRWVSRWLHAVPLDVGTPRVFTEDEACSILPLLIGDAYDDLLTLIAAARLADAAGADASACRYLWRRASRQLLELRCRAAGDVTPNAKWLATRVRRLDLTDVAEATDARSFQAAAKRAGLPEVDEWQLTRLEPAGGAEVIELAGRKRLRTRHDRLLDHWTVASGATGDLIQELGAPRLLEAVRRAELDLCADPDAQRKALSL